MWHNQFANKSHGIRLMKQEHNDACGANTKSETRFSHAPNRGGELTSQAEKMKPIRCQTADENFVIYQVEDGGYCCPVCGAINFHIPPYDTEGNASFEICNCGFEFGYDDSPLASLEAVLGIQANWRRWRRRLINQAAVNSESLASLEKQLKSIRIRLAYDLIDVQEDNENGT